MIQKIREKKTFRKNVFRQKKMKVSFRRFFAKEQKSAFSVSMLVLMHNGRPTCQCLQELIHFSHVSWWECRSCEGFMLCMSSIIYLFVVFLFGAVDDVAFVLYPPSLYL